MATKIYVDAGHNPNSPNAGAEGNGYREQDITYAVAQSLGTLLRNGGYEVLLSRPTPETTIGTSNASSLAQRVNQANEWGADYFVSIHTNASEASSAGGAEVLVYEKPSTAASLAQDILDGLRETTGLKSRGIIERPGLYVLRKTKMPAVLVEMGFISNPSEARLMAEQPELFARGIYEGIENFVAP